MLAEERLGLRGQSPDLLPRLPEAPGGVRRLGTHGDPLTTLLHDQRLSLHLGRALEGFGRTLLSGTGVAGGDLRRFALALEVLVGEWQRQRYEDVLLPWMAKHGVPHTSQILEELRDLYCQEGYLIEVIAQAAERDGRLTRLEEHRVARAALELSEVERRLWLMLAHDVLPALARRAGPAELAELERELATFDEGHALKAKCVRALSEGHQLIARYAPTSPTRARDGRELGSLH